MHEIYFAKTYYCIAYPLFGWKQTDGTIQCLSYFLQLLVSWDVVKFDE